MEYGLSLEQKTARFKLETTLPFETNRMVPALLRKVTYLLSCLSVVFIHMPAYCETSFSSVTSIAHRALSNAAVSSADYDKDGLDDIFLTNYCLDPLDGNTCIYSKLLRNVSSSDNSAASFTAVSTSIVDFHGRSSANWKDINSDGYPELLVSGYVSSTPTTKIYSNNLGVLTDSGISLVGVYSGNAIWGDYDNDGDIDALVCGIIDSSGFPFVSTCQIYSNSSGNFSTTMTNLSTFEFFAGDVQWADYDKDGDLDIAMCGNHLPVGGGSIDVYANNIQILRNDGGGTFVDINAQLPMSDSECSVAWNDVDGNGLLDLITASTGLNDGATKVFLQSAGTFSEHTNSGLFAPNRSVGALNFTDLDGDGKFDLIMTTGPLGLLKIFKNTGSGNFVEVSFASQPPLVAHNGINSIILGKFNSDSRIDIFGVSDLVGSNDSNSVVYLNTSTFNISGKVLTTTGQPLSSALISYRSFAASGSLSITPFFRQV